MEKFTVEDSIFEGVEGRGTALVLNQVTDANIARSSFLSNTHGNTFEHHEISPYASAQKVLKYLYLNRDPSLAVGGALYTAFSNVSIVSSKFIDSRAEIGGALFVYNSSLHVVGSTYSYNKASFAGVMITSESSINIKNSNFIGNAAMIYGGVMIAYRDSFNIHGTTFTNNSANSAGASGGVMMTFDSSFNITSSTFTNNSAATSGGVMDTFDSSFNITSSTFTNNSEAYSGGVMSTFDSSFNITSSTFTNNSAVYGGVMTTSDSSFNITSSTFTNNSAAYGGVMFIFNVKGNCTISGNDAVRGGGIHATSSTIAVYQPGTLQFINNRAGDGSGLYLEINAKLYVLKRNSIYRQSEQLLFRDNHADYGGAIYVADDTNAGACSPDNECFTQTLALHQYNVGKDASINILFFGNTASEQGANIFGGLLDRCIPSPFAEVNGQLETPSHYRGVSYLGNITNINTLGTISSLPVRVCFCKSESEPDCSYQPPTIKVKKGEAFTMPLVAVDQVNHSACRCKHHQFSIFTRWWL